MLNVGFMASGRGSNFQSIIDAMESGHIGNAKPALLVVDKTDAYATKRAKKHNIEYIHMSPSDYDSRDLYFEAVAGEMNSRDVGLVVLAGFMRIVGKPLLDAFPMKVVNIHPALLPSFPGLHGHGDALDYSVKISGCTVHFVDEGMDTGPVIIQAAVPLYHDDKGDSLSERILKLEHKIYPEAVRLISEGKVKVDGRKVIIDSGRRDEQFIINPPIDI